MEQAQQNNADNVSMVSSDELINRNWKVEWNKLNKIMQTMSAWHSVTSLSTGIGRLNGTSSIKIMRTMSAWYPVMSSSTGIGRMNGTSSTK